MKRRLAFLVLWLIFACKLATAEEKHDGEGDQELTQRIFVANSNKGIKFISI